MGLKTEFVEKASKRGANVAALCREYGISRQTGYKWLRRFKADGVTGLEEHSRRPHSVPLGTAEDIVAAIVEERKKRPRWGPTKLRALLVARFGADAPSERTLVPTDAILSSVERLRVPLVSIEPRALTLPPCAQEGAIPRSS